MKYILLCLLALSTILHSSESEQLFEPTPFAHIAIQENGRIKPLDTFARNTLLAVHRKRSAKDGNGQKSSAIQWLTELMTKPEVAFERPIFHVRNPRTVEAIGLTSAKNHLYTLRAIREGFQEHQMLIAALFEKGQEALTTDEKQIVELYNIASFVVALSESLTCVLPRYTFSIEENAQAFEVDTNTPFSFLVLLRHLDQLNPRIRAASKKTPNDLSDADKDMLTLWQTIQQDLAPASKRTNMGGLTVIPSDDPATDNTIWMTPWEAVIHTITVGDKPHVTKHLDAWEQCIATIIAEDSTALTTQSAAVLDLQTTADAKNMSLEVGYNSAEWFYKSLTFYILAAIALVVAMAVWPKALYYSALACVVIALGCQTWGLILRMIIMGRPPVSTLYESILFVGWCGAGGFLILEYFLKNGLGLLLGALLGTIMIFVSLGYAAEGDTLGMLSAVLDSNFWLATHVVTITIGYGMAFIAGLLGHVYLIKRIIQKTQTKDIIHLGKIMYASAIIALFFTLFGTILGGIWGDQSWGRFWGWDPKENGALWIVMWLLMLMHARIGGQMKENGMAAGLVVCCAIVSLAWFGVNLLSVGLHSYGFTDSIFANLMGYVGAELVFAGVALLWARAVNKPTTISD